MSHQGTFICHILGTHVLVDRLEVELELEAFILFSSWGISGIFEFHSGLAFSSAKKMLEMLLKAQR